MRGQEKGKRERTEGGEERERERERGEGVGGEGRGKPAQKIKSRENIGTAFMDEHMCSLCMVV